MCSRSLETRSLPSSLAATHRGFTLITRTACARASYLAALPSTRAMPDRDVFYFADPASPIVFDSCAPAHLKLVRFPTHSLPPSQFYLLCRFSHSRAEDFASEDLSPTTTGRLS